MKFCTNFLRKFDLFAQPVNLLTHQTPASRRRNRMTKHVYKYGSVIGFLLSIVMVGLIVTYLKLAYEDMILSKYDVYST